MRSTDKMKTLIYLGPQILKKFNPECMIFLVWQNCFEFLVEILEIPDNIKSYFLLNMIKSSAIKMIRRKVGHINLLSLSYDTLMSKLEEIFSNYQDEFVARFRFDWRDQIKGESVREYADALIKLIVKCNYGSRTKFNLINRFVIGLRSKKAQDKLLKMKKLSFNKAVYLAECIEFLEKSF
ncbi:hypothetical protein M0804_014954 [Polistes exclamans]|nr:hypothetical protein M0804_014954 [Polistes exclamans]